MKIAYFDTVAGIAGDMTLGAFVSAGLPLEELAEELKKLPVSGFELIGRHVQRNGIDAVHVDVVLSGGTQYDRHLRDILSIIEGGSFSALTKRRATSIFMVIAEAEAKIHNTPLEKVHFHEVGALDSLVDIVGCAICLEKFGIDKIYTSPVRLGSGGMVQTQHGLLPIPTPATLEILRNYPTVLTSVPQELTTPTGAGIVRALSSGILKDEVIVPYSVGYGAGTRDIPELPNLLRVVIGEIESGMEQDRVAIVETNIDDMNPQIYPYLIEKLLASGAHDAYLIPIVMKKGRPGVLLSAMVDEARLDEIVNLIYLQTSTIGVRVQHVGRRKLPRRQIEIETSLGTVIAKAVVRDGREFFAPEFEECKRIAEEKKLPLVDVMRILNQEMEARNPGL